MDDATQHISSPRRSGRFVSPVYRNALITPRRAPGVFYVALN